MRIRAEAKLREIADGLAAIGEAVAHTDLRPPETGLVMLRGRIGGDGAPFNIGEAAVTRCDRAVAVRRSWITSYALWAVIATKARLAADVAMH